MTARARHYIIFCIGMGLSLVAAGLYPILVGLPSAAAQETPVPEETPETFVRVGIYDIPVNPNVTPSGDNSYCAVCHSQEWRAVTLEDGHILNLYMTPDIIRRSVHGDSSALGPLGCVDCHGEDVFPHNGPTPTNARSYALETIWKCTKCHTKETSDLEHGLHEEAILRGNLEAAVCTDCHGSHSISPNAAREELVAGVCGTCHSSTVQEWRSSAHVDIGPLGCATCHSPHSQRIRVEDTDILCLNCHKVPSEIYAHTEHVNTTFSVKCIDCHMFREADAQTTLVGLAPTGHTMLMDTRPCNTCHEELEVTGRWSELTRQIEEQITGERDELQLRVSELETQIQSARAAAEGGISFTQLIQGLVIGLGIGATLAVVFIPRLARNSSVKGDHNRDE